jgi:hypothetical protein
MLNKVLLVLIVLVLLMALSQSVVPDTLLNDALHAISLISIAGNLAILMMLINGTFRRSKYFRYVYGVVGFLIVAVIFKILHLPFADQLMSLPFLLILILYLLHFFSKPVKDHLDYLKLITVFFLSLTSALYALNFLSDEVTTKLEMISRWVLFLTFIDFVVMGIRRKSLV